MKQKKTYNVLGIVAIKYLLIWEIEIHVFIMTISGILSYNNSLDLISGIRGGKFA